MAGHGETHVRGRHEGVRQRQDPVHHQGRLSLESVEGHHIALGNLKEGMLGVLVKFTFPHRVVIAGATVVDRMHPMVPIRGS